MTQDFPDRPEHIPRGYEWLPDAYKRDVEPRGPDARERVRYALGEGDIEAVLFLDLGNIEPIDQRMWRKTPIARKVLPRFQDGRITMSLKLYEGRKVSGWVLVQEGSLAQILSAPTSISKRSRVFSRPELRRWYKERIEGLEAADSIPSRDEDWKAACEQFGKRIPRAIVREIRRELAPVHWKKGGRRPEKSGQI